MGKYMRKSKTTGEVALMEVWHHQSPLTLGVRTRAKTLALQKLTAEAPSTASSGGGSYLELRSRRLEKPTFVRDQKRQKQLPEESPNPKSNSRASSRLRVGSVNSGSVVGSESLKEEKGSQLERQKVVVNKEQEIQEKNAGIEASFGENVLEFESRERGRRETTPCSLLRDPDTIRTPGSTTRPANSTEASGTAQNSNQKHIPTAHEMNEFFTGAEDEQQKQFTEKYNFDPVNEKPLPGRYEWMKVDP